MSPCCRLSFAACLIALSLVGPTAAPAQENPVLDPQSAHIPLPANVPDLQQRHPWVPNGGGFTLSGQYVQGSWANTNGSRTIVTCLLVLASENPNWQQQDMRTTDASGGVSCNEQMHSVSGEVRAINYGSPTNPDQVTQLGSTGYFSSLSPASNGFYEGRAHTYFVRNSDSTTQQIKLNVTLELPTGGGRTAVGWNSNPPCDRPSQRIVVCELTSVPYQHVPYPCPAGKVGIQPPGCQNQPQVCPTPQIGIQPNCLTPPPTTPCPSPQIGIGSTCVTPPPPPSTTPCPSPQIGIGTMCVTPPPSGPCPSGQIGIGSTCFPLQPTGPCPSGQVGIGGICVTPPQGSQPPSNTGAPVITGRARQDERLAASSGSWTNGPHAYDYQWQRCAGSSGACTDIAGGKGPTYLTQAADVGSTMRVVVTATNAGGSRTAASNRTATIQVPAAPTNLSPPTIQAPATITPGTALTATLGTWDTDTAAFTYQWEVCFVDFCSDIRGAVADRYVVTQNDVGGQIRVAVTAQNTTGGTRAVSARVGPVQALAPGPPAEGPPPLPVEEPCPYGALPPDVPVQHGCEADDRP